MEHVNEVVIRGELAADAEIRTTGTGRHVANLFVRTRRSWKGRDGTRQERTDHHRVTAWGELAERCRDLRKGAAVRLEGRLQTRSYQDRDGAKKYVTEVVARELEAIGDPPPARQPDEPADWGELPF